MTTYCPRCGEAGRDEAVVTPLVTVWSSCERCQFVWRSSLLDAVMGYAMRRVGLARYQKAEDRYSASAPSETAELSQSLAPQPVSPDRVAEWLMGQEKPTSMLRLAPVRQGQGEAADVEEFFDRLDPVEAPRHNDNAPKEDFYSFFSDDIVSDELSVDESFVAESLVAEPLVEEPLVEEPVLEKPVVEQPPVDVHASNGTRLEASVDRALTNVEDLYDAFKRLEQQLGGMEKVCEQLVNSR